jgi:HD superfamily phosphodiesterase
MFKIPTIEMAEAYLKEASALNPGSWIEHSRNVALSAKLIAECCNELDSEAAYILGLLHDIGRREGKMQARHALDGYRFMLEQGYEDCARICLTHTFQCMDVNGVYDSWDCPDEDI